MTPKQKQYIEKLEEYSELLIEEINNNISFFNIQNYDKEEILREELSILKSEIEKELTLEDIRKASSNYVNEVFKFNIPINKRNQIRDSYEQGAVDMRDGNIYKNKSANENNDTKID